jgi:Transglycosylase SLT domain
MKPIPSALTLFGLWLIGSSLMKTTPAPDFVRMRKLIRGEAIRQGVPTEIALATARVESNFDPTVEGDRNWHLNTERFERVVPKGHPHRSEREAWHSYGLFQLLAPYHVRMDEHPRVLLDPAINAARGVAALKRLLDRHNGDPSLVRRNPCRSHYPK